MYHTSTSRPCRIALYRHEGCRVCEGREGKERRREKEEEEEVV